MPEYLRCLDTIANAAAWFYCGKYHPDYWYWERELLFIHAEELYLASLAAASNAMEALPPSEPSTITCYGWDFVTT